MSGAPSAADVRRAAETVGRGLATSPRLWLLARTLEDARHLLPEGAVVDVSPGPSFAPGDEPRSLRLVVGGEPDPAVAVILRQGRPWPAAAIAGLVRTCRVLGGETLFVLESATALHPLWCPGEVALVADHIDWTGENPLVGRNDAEAGPRFPDLSDAYDRELRSAARAQAAARGVTLREGVMAGLAAPGLPTAAERRMLRAAGADATATGIVHEAVAARHAGLRVLALATVVEAPGDAPDEGAATDLVAEGRAAAAELAAAVARGTAA